MGGFPKCWNHRNHAEKREGSPQLGGGEFYNKDCSNSWPISEPVIFGTPPHGVSKRSIWLLVGDRMKTVRRITPDTVICVRKMRPARH